MLFESWITLLTRYLFFTIVVEAINSFQDSFNSGLASMGIQIINKLKLFSQSRVISKHFSLPNTRIVHPITKHFITDKLSRPNCFINGGYLLLLWVDFVLVDKHV